MAQFNDSYYDPPEDDEPCKICHYSEGDCTCLVCEVCDEVGNPECINVHMPWQKWGHFNHQRSDREMKAEIEAERKMAEQEKMWEELDKFSRL